MAIIIDRRKNPKDKSIVNRQRFLNRVRARVKAAVNDVINKSREIKDTGGEEIKISAKDLYEPRFVHGAGGIRRYVLTGNEIFKKGDLVERPKKGGGDGEGGSNASNSSNGEEDAFQFTLTRAEFLDLFFEDLELPDLVKTELAQEKEVKWRRAGYTTVGSVANLSVIRSMKQAYCRRLALRGPLKQQLRELEEEYEKELDNETPSLHHPEILAALEKQIEELKRRIARVPFIDTTDIRYRTFTQEPQPITKAVMFCLMDVSGSMGEYEKDIAKRFYMLLYLFLEKSYESVDLVFIRHTTEAKEVDEEEFFYSKDTGGTIVSSALEVLKQIIAERYNRSTWNIYVAQASDGDNWDDDSSVCYKLITEEIIHLVQHFFYIQISRPDERDSDMAKMRMMGSKTLWAAYDKIKKHYNNFSMEMICGPSEIYPVFRKLFAKKPK